MKEFKRIIVTGADGMLGRGFKQVLSEGDSGCLDCLFLSHLDLDVTNLDEVMRLTEYSPDLIIHCAALVNADFCESNYQQAFDVIVGGTENIISLAEKTHAKVFYPQSFLIFDGIENPITEETKPNPLSTYGKLKLEAEQKLLESTVSSLIVRMAGFFGGMEKDKNFVGKFIVHLIELIKKDIRSVDVGDRVWQPTYTKDLALNSMLLLNENHDGIYNMSCHGEASFYELAVKIVENLDLNSKITINQVSSEKFNTKEPAKRPLKAIFNNKKLHDNGLDIQRSWIISLQEYLSEPYFKKLLIESGVKDD